MRKKIIVTVGLLMLGILATEAQTLMVNETTAPAKGELEIKIIASDDIDNYIATGFFIELPEGFSLKGAECEKSTNVTSDHLVRFGQVDDNRVRVAVYSLTNSPLVLHQGVSSGQEGPLLPICSLKLKAPDKTGSFTGNLSGIEFATTSYSLKKETDVAFNICVDGTAGDANGDGSLDINDAICIVNYLTGNPVAGFNAAAADVNGDGQVTIADAVIVVNIILN